MTLYPDPIINALLKICGGYLVVALPCLIVLLIVMWRAPYAPPEEDR